MASSKELDITKVGPVGFRQLQAANELDGGNKGLSEEYLAKKKELLESTSAISPGILGIQPDRDVMSPLAGSNVGWGESRYDDLRMANQNQFENLADLRAEQQPWYSKIANGLGKGVILTGTTFLDGTVGLVFGAGTAIAEGRWSGLWDNDFSKAMQAVNDWSEQAMPNYYTEEEQQLSRERPFSAQNIFSANFIGDKFLKNLGFTVGAFYSGSVAAKAIQATKLPNLIGKAAMAGAGRTFNAATEAGSATKLAEAINAVGKAVDAPAMVTSAVGTVISAVNEGRIEALNNTRDWYNLEKAKLDDLAERQAQEIEAEYNANQGKEMFAVAQPDGTASYIDPAFVKYQQAKKDLQGNYERAMAKLNEDRAKMGNADLLMNLPILIASNAIEFGKLYANGYKTARKGVNIVNKSKYAGKDLSTAWAEAQAAGVGMKEFAQEFAQFGAEEAKKGLFGTLGRVGKNMATTALPEGLEEISQKAASTVAGDYYSADVHNFYTSKMDPDATEETISWAKAFAQGINETINDGSSWEEFFIGALTGALGMPVFGRANTSASDTYLGKGKAVGLRGGIFGEMLANREEVARANTVANYINDRIKSPELINYYQGMTRHNAHQAGMDRAAINGDEFNFKNHEFAQMVSDIMMFDNAGKIGDLLTLINSAYDTSTENLESIIKNTTSIQTDASGAKKLVGPFAKYATINAEGKVAPNFGDEAQQQEMAQKLTESRDEMLKTISDYQLEKDKLDIMTGQRLSDDQLQELTWIKMQSKDWLNRGTQLAKESRDILSHIVKQQSDRQELATFFKTQEGAHAKPKKRVVNGKEIFDFGPSEEYKALSAQEREVVQNVKVLDSFLALDDESLFLSLGDPSNEGIVESLKKMAESLYTVSPDEIGEFKQKMDDMRKLKDGMKTYNEKLTEFLNNPEKQAEELKAADAATQKAEETKKKNAVARRIDFKAPTAAVAEALKENAKDIEALGGFDAFIKDLSPDEAKKARSARNFNKAMAGLDSAIESAELTNEQKRIARALVEREAAQSNNVNEVAAKIAESLDRGAVKEALMSSAPQEGITDLATATKIADAEAKLKDFFDTAMKQQADAVSELEKADSDALDKAADAIDKAEGKNTDEKKVKQGEKLDTAEQKQKAKEATKDGHEGPNDDSPSKKTIKKVPEEKKGPESKVPKDKKDKGAKVPKEAKTPKGPQAPASPAPQGPSTPTGTDKDAYQPTPGETTASQTQDAVQKANKDIKAPSPSSSNIGNKPQLSQFYLFGRNRQTYLDYLREHPDKIPGGIDKEAYLKYIEETHKYLDDHGAFRYVSGIDEDDRLTLRAPIEFRLNKELSEKAGVPVVLMITKDKNGRDQVIGSLPTELDFNGTYAGTKQTLKEKRPAQYALYQEVIKRAESEPITTTVATLMGGRIEFSDNLEQSVASTFQTQMASGKAPVIAVLNEDGHLFTGDPKLDSEMIDPLSTSSAVTWSIYAMIPANNGKLLPALCYSRKIADILGDPADWYINQTIDAIGRIPLSIADLKDNIRSVYKWLNIPGLSFAIGTGTNDANFKKETEDVSRATSIRMSFTNPDNTGKPITTYFTVTDGKISREEVREKLADRILKHLPELTTNVDIKRLTDSESDKEYRKQISQYLMSNILSPHAVNDWFTYNLTDIEKGVGKKEEKQEPKKPVKKREPKGNEVKVTIDGKDYFVEGTRVVDGNDNPVSPEVAKKVLDAMTAPAEPATPVEVKSAETSAEGANTDKVFTALNMGGVKNVKIGTREAKGSRWSKGKKLLVTDTDDAAATEKQLYQDTERVAKLFPQLSEAGRIVVVNGLIRTVDEAGNPVDAYGEFRDGILYISNQSPIGTAYHEAFHYVTTMIMDENEQLRMFSEARQQYGDLSDMALEEKLAESFRDYMNGYNDKSLLGRIKTFFRNLKHVIDGLTGRLTYLDSLFFNIYRGRYSNRQERFGTLEEQRILRNAPRDSQGRLLAPNGKPSNLTERQYAQVRTKAFKDWFGDWENDPKNASKVVDENGEPLVVYHHTKAGVSEITSYIKGELVSHKVTKKARPIEIFSHKYTGTDGFYFTSNPVADNIYTPNGLYGAYTTIPVFLNIRYGFEYKKDSHTAYKIGQNLEEAKRRYEELEKKMNEVASRENFTDSDQNELDGLMQQQMAVESDMKTTYISDIGNLFSDELRRSQNLGNNGIIEISDTETFYVVDDANQIKSASENSGRFSPNNDNFYDRLVTYKSEQLAYDNLDNETKQSLEAKRVTQEDYEDLSVEDKESILFCLL